MKRPPFEIRIYVILFLSVLLLVNMYRTGLTSIAGPAIVVATAVLLDGVIILIKKRHYEFPKSALITGLIISELLEPEMASQYLYILPPVAAILSKHLIKFSNRHIFNPAAFGLFVTTLILPTGLTWWAANPVYLVLIFSAFILYKIRSYPLVLSYVIVCLVLFSSQAIFRQTPVLDSIYMINPYFAGIMLTEHKTAPMTLQAKVVFGVIVGIMSFVLLQFLPQYDYSILSLLFGNLLVPFINQWLKPKPSAAVAAKV